MTHPEHLEVVLIRIESSLKERPFSWKIQNCLFKALPSPVTVAGKGLMTRKCPILAALVRSDTLSMERPFSRKI